MQHAAGISCIYAINVENVEVAEKRYAERKGVKVGRESEIAG